MSKHPLILLHGWGFSSRIWQPLIRELQQRDLQQVFAIDLPGFGSAFHEPCDSLEQVLDFIVEQLPEKSILCGWSLGGMLAVQIAARWPERVAEIITLGSNLHFTACSHLNNDKPWPGMPPADYEQFCARFAVQPEKTWQRFLTLQTRNDHHAEHANTTLELLADYSSIHTDTATNMLRLLGEIDNRDAFAVLTLPGLHVLAEQDAITPAAITPLLKAINPAQQVEILTGSGHAMPVSRTAQLATAITDFIAGKKIAVPKSRVATSFSRAANSYDQAAKLQRQVGSALLATLPAAFCGTVIDIGCGTGFISGQLLKKHHDNTNVVALDLAAGMLAHAAQQHVTAKFVQADMECLPLANESADYLLSSLALQWANDPPQCFQEWRRVLKPNGKLFFATFLPGTLRELETCWQAVDSAVHVNRFVEQEILLSALHTAGFTDIAVLTATHTLFYPQLRDLAQELKAIGAHNMNEGKPAGLTGKQRWASLQVAYESLRTERGLPASYEVLYVSAH